MKLLILSNFGMGLYKFHKELIEQLIQEGNQVYLSFPKDEYVPKLMKLGAIYLETNVDRRGMNILKDFKLFLTYRRLIKNIKPHMVFTFTIKPNIYGGLACSLTNTPYITNITGIGSSFQKKGLLQWIVRLLYKVGLKKAICVFFQNEANREVFIKKHLVKGRSKLIPGAGVNLIEFPYEEYPLEEVPLKFLFIGRIMKEKGIDELLLAAKVLKEKYSYLQFELVGFYEEDYSEIICQYEEEGIIIFYGQQEEVFSYLKNTHALILPSYHEGMANVLMEAAAVGRPVLASNIPGCKEAFDSGISGLEFEAKNADSLIRTLTQFIEMPYIDKRRMGLAGRSKAEVTFNRHIIIDTYKAEMRLVTLS